MNIALLTNEYPPNIYGGAGVHVEYLTRELANLEGRKHSIEVLCFGEQKEEREHFHVQGVEPKFHFPTVADVRHKKVFDPLLRNLVMAGSLAKADVVHCHTWYSHFGGCLVKQLLDAVLVLTTHSLEPHRPWKEEQLGRGYEMSSWIERTAYQNADGVIAVSQSMKEEVEKLYGVQPDKVKIIHNGIDLKQYQPRYDRSVLERYGVNPDVPYVLFVGRITRQKGILHLVNAIAHLKEGVQVVLCAGAPDTPEIGVEMKQLVDEARRLTRNSIVWISEMLPRQEIIAFYSQAAVFVCPSVYEPFGIINLEAMACETPVVASKVGGIPEVVVDGETGFLVPIQARSLADPEPIDKEKFSHDLADAMNRILNDSTLAKSMAIKGRERVEKYFSWSAIARQTLEFYEELLKKKGSVLK
ncbi:MAG: glycogen synthase [Verrucomicrobiae bacterium]|nr:glycogen synthase [Verrucomicrobiae bacterium]